MIQPTLIHAFADGERGGNPAGVVLDADDLDAAACQRIAAAAGVPETAFVSRSDIATLRLTFFTPTRQIAHCGHATVATFGLLHRLGRLGEGEFRKETIDGVRDVRIAGGRVFLAQTPRSIDTDLVRDVALADQRGDLRRPGQQTFADQDRVGALCEFDVQLLQDGSLAGLSRPLRPARGGLPV